MSLRPTEARAARHPWRHHRSALALTLLVLLTGCVTGAPLDTGGGGPGPASIPPQLVQGRLVELDAFEALLLGAGLNDSSLLPPREADFTPEDAAELHDVLLSRPVTLARFGPRLAASYLLREVMEGEEELPRSTLLARVERFAGLAVLRPDGYLAWALNGQAQQRVGQIVLKEGALSAGPFEVGRFYSGRGGVFLKVDEHLQPVRTAPPLAEVYSDADVINRTLDGAEDAFRDTVLAMGGLVFHPGDSLAALSQLPQGVAALILRSPEYLERFQLMTRGEQIRTLSRLTVTVLATYGTAAGTTRTVATAGRGLEFLSMPALSLSADGALMFQRAAIPAGRAITALGGGPGAAIVLHMANQSIQGPGKGAGSSAQAQGPGQWSPVKESMSRRAARYQEQISGHPVDQSYIVKGVRFDGYKNGVLLEAKGRGYANKFLGNLTPQLWFANKGARSMVDQVQRQSKAANGIPIHWHVAETKAAEAIRLLLRRASVQGIDVIHTPALP
ncbi:hypothetical protein JRI60_09655 [Archangium violaceum]|uniref:Tox-REase-5 domain-containing protein n=1 Tax=Archangium violaceum TaxID=83451 RepID=UPI00194EE7B7|nr:Tox-REase-5 domain-containing protein [Archangium violaceum]QRN99257.1 hypothetical protein JRI60_09655 [Archangium violaceum]